MGRTRKYSAELKERAVRLALESDRPLTHVAADLGVGPESLRQWVRQARADAAGPGGSPAQLTSGERERLKQLERENLELRSANQILRDASVFFAKELDRTPRR